MGLRIKKNPNSKMLREPDSVNGIESGASSFDCPPSFHCIGCSFSSGREVDSIECVDFLFDGTFKRHIDKAATKEAG